MNISGYDQGISGWRISGYQVCRGHEDNHVRETMSTLETIEDNSKYMRRALIYVQ